MPPPPPEPAYARRLLRRRWAGHVPERVHVLLGEAWEPDVAWDCWLAAAPRRFVPGVLDWRCVTDLRVVVHDRAAAAKPVAGWPLSVWLAAEIADYAGVVLLDTPAPLYDHPPGRGVAIDNLAWDAIEQTGESPPWWPAARSMTHDQRHERFLAAERERRGWRAVIAAPDLRPGLRGRAGRPAPAQ